MTGRIAQMNSAAVFISLLFWGWLWGIWGMLLSIPIIVIVKVVSQHVEQLHPLRIAWRLELFAKPACIVSPRAPEGGG